MTQVILQQASFISAGISALMDMVKEMNAKRIERKAYWDTYRQLTNMADKDLRDIGICRGDIAAVAAGKNVRKGNL